MESAKMNSAGFDHQVWLDRRRALIQLIRIAKLDELDEHTLTTVCDMLMSLELTEEQAFEAFNNMSDQARKKTA